MDWYKMQWRLARTIAFRVGTTLLSNQRTKGKLLVYLQYLASAPWNSPLLVEAPIYFLVGKNFIAAAIQESIKQEFKGRIGLHALPQAEGYYSKICKMTNLGKDPTVENLRYFEMAEKQAQKFINKGAK